MTRTELTDLLSKAKAATFSVYRDPLETRSNFMKLDAESITRLAESYLEAIEILRWYSDDDSHGCGEFIWKKTAYEADAGKRAREFLRKIGEI